MANSSSRLPTAVQPMPAACSSSDAAGTKPRMTNKGTNLKEHGDLFQAKVNVFIDFASCIFEDVVYF